MSRYLAIFLAALAAWGQTPLKSGTTENLRGISVVSDKVAWASGTHGTYLRTRDGGSSWQAAQVPGAEGLDFRDVEAFGADVAYLLAAGPGEQSRIYKTTDAGAHWGLQFTNVNPKGFFDCMAFWDVGHGIAVGDPVADGLGKLRFEVMVTADGGGHWNAVAANAVPEAVEGEGSFAASGTCVAVQGKKNAWFVTGGKVARVFRSRDRGRTWTVADTPMVHGAASAGIFSVAFRDSKHGTIAGGDYKDPATGEDNLAFTEDGGKTWALSGVRPQAYFSAVAYDRKLHRILATGTALTIEIEGNKTQKLSEQNLNALGVTRSGKAIAVGPKGLVVELTGRDGR